MSCDWKGKIVSSPSSSPTDIQLPIIIPPLEKTNQFLSNVDRRKVTVISL